MELQEASEGSLRVQQALAFALPVALIVYYALRGGSYDIVVRGEEAVAVWWIVGLGYAFGVLPRARPPRSVAVPLVALLLLAIWMAIGLHWTESSERTYSEVARALHYLGLAVLVWSLVDRRTWRHAAAGVATAAVGVSGLALLSRLAPGSFPTDYILAVFHSNRLSYPFAYWNAVATWAAMSVAMALAWSAHARTAWARWLFLAAVPVCGTVAYLTYSRQAVAGVVLAVLAVVLLSRNRWVVLVNGVAAGLATLLSIREVRQHEGIVQATSGKGAGSVVLVLVLGAGICAGAVAVTTLAQGDRWRMAAQPGRIAAVVGTLAVLIVGGVAGHSAIAKRWNQFRTQTVVSVPVSDPAKHFGNLNGTRYEQWRTMMKAFDAHPFHGIGAGTFEFWWNRHSGLQSVRDTHSLYVDALGGTGLPGFLLTVAFLVGLAFVALRARSLLSTPVAIGANAAMVAGFAVFLLHAGVDWMWQVPAVSALAFVAIAVAAGAASVPALPALPLAARIAVVFAAIVFAAVQLPDLVSTSRLRTSQSELRSGDVDGAIAAANDAVRSEPWASTPYVQRGLVSEFIGRLPAARADLERAVEREPTNWRPRLLLSRIQAEQGDAAAALATFRAAKALRPQSDFFKPPG